jgi:hypothetical protein
VRVGMGERGSGMGLLRGIDCGVDGDVEVMDEYMTCLMLLTLFSSRISCPTFPHVCDNLFFLSASLCELMPSLDFRTWFRESFDPTNGST